MRTSATDRRRSIATVLLTLFAWTLTAWTISPPLARADGGGSIRGDTIRIASNPLEAASLGFARAVTGDSEDFSRFFAADGIRLQLDGPPHAGISSRQAIASLRKFLRRFDGGQTFVSRASPVDDSPERAFAEVLWSAYAAGTSDETHRTLFLGLFREGDDWRVDEVRLLR